jgi:hypothetical protein
MKSFSAILAVALASAAPAQTTISVDAAAALHGINPLIYGVAWATTQQLQDLNFTFNRAGGNAMTRYNWLENCDNRGNDWYFESYADQSAIQGYRDDSFILDTKKAHAQAAITMPMIPYLGKVGPNRSSLRSFSQRKYGAQDGWDPYNYDAGNGISSRGGNPYVKDNNPLDASTPNSPEMQANWVDHLIDRFGKASEGGLKYYLMDNEQSIWFGTHRDVHPIGPTMDEIYQDYLNYAGAIRQRDPYAVIMGPEEWGWDGYFYSGYDQWYGVNKCPDRKAHGNMDYIPWLLRQLCTHQRLTGERLLNVLSVHYYPQQGETGEDDSSDMQAIRNRSTRSLWDPNYTDTSWINSVVDLIPRLKNWTRTFYPNTLTGITEYDWGDEAHMNGATAQADILGILGREDLDMASRWGIPATDSPAYLAMKMYRNYDGANGAFGSVSCACSAPNPDQLSAFASIQPNGGLTVMVINKLTSSTPISLQVAHIGLATSAKVWQISSDSQTAIQQVANASVSGGTISTTVPAQSVTLFVIPKGTSTLSYQYDFESNSEGWTDSDAPITGIGTSTAEAFSGSHSLAVNITANGSDGLAFVSNPSTPAGATVTFHVWIPANSQITAIQPYVQQGASGGWAWTGNWQPISGLQTNAWNAVQVTVPSNATTPLYQLGVQFFTGSTAWTGTCYIDAIGW